MAELGSTTIYGDLTVTGNINGEKQVFSAYDSGGEIDISSGWTDITWDTEWIKDDIFVHSSDSAEITINKNIDCIITAEISAAYVPSGGWDRSTSHFRVLKNGSEITGMMGFLYHRAEVKGENTGVATGFFALSSGDSIKVQAERYGGSAPIRTLPDSCRISIIEE